MKVFQRLLTTFYAKGLWFWLSLAVVAYFFSSIFEATKSEDTIVNEYVGMRSVINGDASGYYCFLPAAFIYDFDAKAFPDSIEQRLGDGFKLNRANGKVESKYPPGFAICVAPFFLYAHQKAKIKDGFSPVYQLSVRYAAAFFCCAGLFLFFV